ncbi:uncharacterized protein LOC142635859 [Castanea sativa]|uniref:uncharacterized protein LOC142635859 n=1 Tax=Castanea sativa TaxID=21020 RepID=UPI003F652893
MDAIKLYSTFRGVLVKFKKNDKVRVRVKCTDSCLFKLYCGKMKDEDTLIVKKLNQEHNCGRQFRNRFASSNWLGKHLVDDVRSDPNVKMSVIKDRVVNKFKVHISRYQASRAKGRAKELVHRTFTKQYAQLGDYCEELLRSNLRSTILISTNRPQPHLQPKFERLYVCLDACKRGFLAVCRPFIGVDGCHLKETKDSWTWFMKRLLDDIGSLRAEGWTFMSDQQKGLTQMFDELMPGVDHRFCVRHLYNNFSKDYKGKLLKDRIWATARATNMSEFQFEMGKIKKLNTKAWEWDKPIITMLEEIRLHLMAYYIKKKEKMARYHGPICPRIQNKLKTEKVNSTNWVPVWCGDSNESKFEVSKLPDKYVVYIKRTCSCGSWDLTGIPCAHSIAALGYIGHTIEDYVHHCYSMESLTQTYGSCVYPINGPKLWPQSGRETILPPKKIRQGGRPKKKEFGELNNPYKMKRRIDHVKCSQCGKIGHNKRRCTPATNKSATQASKQQRVREPNVTTQSLEDHNHGASSSHVEPTNEAVHPSQTSHEAHANQHNEKRPIRKGKTTTQSQPASQCEGVHRIQPASQVRHKEVTRSYNFGVSTKTMVAASETSRRITKFYMNAQLQK